MLVGDSRSLVAERCTVDQQVERAILHLVYDSFQNSSHKHFFPNKYSFTVQNRGIKHHSFFCILVGYLWLDFSGVTFYSKHYGHGITMGVFIININVSARISVMYDALASAPMSSGTHAQIHNTSHLTHGFKMWHKYLLTAMRH